jgi:hypothetical protein
MLQGHQSQIKTMRLTKLLYPDPQCFKAITSLAALAEKSPYYPTPCTALWRDRGTRVDPSLQS